MFPDPAVVPIIEPLLIAEEGFRGFVYDDATGKSLLPGDTIKGHPTVGYGLALDVDPLTRDEALMLMRNRYQIVELALGAELLWFGGITTIRKAVFISMAYQMGMEGFLGFHEMLVCAAQNDWTGVASAMMESEWAEQTPSRALQLSTMVTDIAAS